jgi:hypothetical protein
LKTLKADVARLLGNILAEGDEYYHITFKLKRLGKPSSGELSIVRRFIEVFYLFSFPRINRIATLVIYADYAWTNGRISLPRDHL